MDLHLFAPKSAIPLHEPASPNATIAVDISPNKWASGMSSGRALRDDGSPAACCRLVLLPMISIMGALPDGSFPPITPANALNPATGGPFLISEMSPGQIWSAYIRYIGAGAVLAAGMITLGRTLPTIISSAREGLKGFGAGGTRANCVLSGTCR